MVLSLEIAPLPLEISNNIDIWCHLIEGAKDQNILISIVSIRTLISTIFLNMKKNIYLLSGILDRSSKILPVTNAKRLAKSLPVAAIFDDP